jgi:heptosyltransferase-2
MALRIPASSILVRCPNWVGDAVMATPTLRCLRRNYPDAKITLLVRPYVRQVCEDAPWFDEMVEWRGFLSSYRALRGREFELAVLLVHSFDSALLARMIGATHRVGHTRGDQGFLLTDAIPWPREHHRRLRVPKVDLYAGITAYLGCEGSADKRQELFYNRSQAEAVADTLRRKDAPPDRPLVTIVPGAAFGSSKHWSAKSFAAVADALAEKLRASVAAIASRDEEEIVQAIRAEMKTPLISFDEGEMDLGRLKPLVASSSLMVTTDTGPRHYAVAFNVPVAVLMGPTDPRNTDSDYARTAILRHDLECAPCHRRKCPKDHKCMDLITVDEVLAACDDLLARFGPVGAWKDRLTTDEGRQAKDG